MAYNFNGTNQYFSMSPPAVNTPLTMACWFRSTSTTTNQRLVGVYVTGGDYWDLGIRGADAGDPVAAIVNAQTNHGNIQIVATTAGYTANTWHHAAGVFSSATSRTAYLDGGNSATGTTNLTNANAVSARIGVFFGEAIQFMNGQIAEVGIWNAALTAAEIASLAKGMTCDKVRPQSLVFYAPLIRDLTEIRSGLAVTNNNSATVANHPRVYA